jgi:hypothetical protein
VQVVLQLRSIIGTGDWAAVRTVVMRGRGVLADIGGVSGADTSLPEECIREFQLIESEVDDREVIR